MSNAPPRHARSYPPAIGVCGKSGSGKTLLIESLLPRLTARGLRVAVIKHCTHRIEADRPGKDSDRIFQAGADVLAAGPHESFARFHADQMPLDECLRRMAGRCDLVLVEGCRDASIPKIWVAQDAAEANGDPAEHLLVLPDARAGCAAAEDVVWQVVACAHANLPTLAAVLIGGRSSRMGRPKHLLDQDGVTLAERAVAAVEPQVAEVLLVGSGEAPAPLAGLRRLPDAPGVEGPVAGVLSAMRWHPDARWLVLPCDLPLVSREAVGWLLGQARVGADAVCPQVREAAPGEPLFAVYEPACRLALEAAVERGEWSLQRAVADLRIAMPSVPSELRRAWTNVNSPDEWDALQQGTSAEPPPDVSP